ncbi:MAG: AraC family transcriptional regulator [Oscillospiraceae bacterium]|nr:AraC family transcriptional regulator [Oscillospiraceae bacterium]
MKRTFKNVFKNDYKLYIEHIWVSDNLFPAGRCFIVAAYIAYGKGTLIIGNDTVRVSRGDFVMVNPDATLECVRDNEHGDEAVFEIHYICFERDFFNGAWEQFADEFPQLENFVNGTDAYIRGVDNENFELRDIIVEMIREYYGNMQGRKSALTGRVKVFVTTMFRLCGMPEKKIFSKNMLVDQTIRQIREYIYQNVKPSELAAHRYVTREHLGRVFKEETGMTLTEYINKLKVDMIKDILRNTDRHIEDIPLLFNSNAKYIQKIFRKYTGMTMRDYRAKHRK